MNLVFVYGSLKKGFHNNYILSDSQFIGIATTKHTYDMFSYGTFPAVIKTGKYKIKGEIYYVDDDVLKKLDRLESNGSFYKREEIDTALVTGVWCYFLMSGHDVRLDNQEGIMVSGNVKSWVK